MQTDRRSLLKTGLGLTAGASALGAVPGGLGSLAAAQASTRYKAVVFILLQGGMDAYDTLIPTDPGAYDAYATARKPVLTHHEEGGDESRRRENLIGLEQDGRATGVGVPRQLAPLAALYRQGALSFAANTGALEERLTRADVVNKRARLPLRIGSHNDQQSLWMTTGPEGASAGWGGSMVEAFGKAASPFAHVSFAGNSPFVAGRFRPPYLMAPGTVSLPGGTQGTNFGSRDVTAALNEHYRASATRMNNLFATDYQNAQREAVNAAHELSEALNGVTDGDAVPLPENRLSDQLGGVAKMIALRGKLGIERQVFFARHGGFDTHRDQAADLPSLQTQLADALSSFYQETIRQGVAEDVLTIAITEFGRTLTPNSHGTDHGWGAHQIFMGGGIRGGMIHGELPEVGLDHDLDFDRGRLIPTTSIEQVAGGAMKWFGLGESDIKSILPRHGNIGPALSL